MPPLAPPPHPLEDWSSNGSILGCGSNPGPAIVSDQVIAMTVNSPQAWMQGL